MKELTYKQVVELASKFLDYFETNDSYWGICLGNYYLQPVDESIVMPKKFFWYSPVLFDEVFDDGTGADAFRKELEVMGFIEVMTDYYYSDKTVMYLPIEE